MIQIKSYDFDLSPLFISFFNKRLERLVKKFHFDPVISLLFFKTGQVYHGELKINDLDLSLGCFDQSEDLLELFKGLEKEMILKMGTWQLRANYQNINFY